MWRGKEEIQVKNNKKLRMERTKWTGRKKHRHETIGSVGEHTSNRTTAFNVGRTLDNYLVSTRGKEQVLLLRVSSLRFSFINDLEITFTQKRKSHIPIGKGQNEELYSCWNGKFDPVILHKVWAHTNWSETVCVHVYVSMYEYPRV